MNELMHRRVAEGRKFADKQDALMRRARSLTGDEARKQALKLHQHPQDEESFWTLVRHYEYKVNIRDLNALRLWYIEHQPEGKIWPGNINPRLDRAGYERGKTLWLAHAKRPGAKNADAYRRAADTIDSPMCKRLQPRRSRSGSWSKRLGRL